MWPMEIREGLNNNLNFLGTLSNVLEKIFRFVFRYVFLPWLLAEVIVDWHLRVLAVIVRIVFGYRLRLSLSRGLRKIMFGNGEDKRNDRGRKEGLSDEKYFDDLDRQLLEKEKEERGRLRQVVALLGREGVPMKIVVTMRSMWRDFLLVFERSDYLFDRYVKHSPLCLVKRLNPSGEKTRYVFKDIELTKYDGFRDYVNSRKKPTRNGPLQVEDSISNISEGEMENIRTSTKEGDAVEVKKRIDLNEYKPSFHKPTTPELPLALRNLQADTNEENKTTKYLRTEVRDLAKAVDGIQHRENTTSAFTSHEPKKEETNIFSNAPIYTFLPQKNSTQQNINPSFKIINIELPKSRKTIKLSFTSRKEEKPSKPGNISELSQPPKAIIRSIDQNDVEYISKIKEAVREILPKTDYDDGSFAPIVLRLAWHCCATYDKTTGNGGSNGATMRFVPEITDEGNTGLEVARSVLEPIKQRFSRITYSDLWTLAGAVAVEEMGGPSIPWKCGRMDCIDSKHIPPNGRLPFGYKDANHIRDTFTRMGFDDRETVVLLGSHGLGRCHMRYSGWEGKWTINPLKFGNDFFKLLLQENWSLGIVPETGREQYFNDDKTLMMLNTDLELIRDPYYLQFVKLYAENETLFFNDYSRAFGKLLELGIERDSNGHVLPKKEFS